MKRADEAVKLFENGYNCAQAVAGAFADVLNLPQQEVMRLASGFGGGVGRLREVCGAVCGMTFVAGALTENSDEPSAKTEVYRAVQALAAEYKQSNRSIVCRELLGLSPIAETPPEAEKRTAEYYKKRPCKELVRQAAEILEKYYSLE